ncbi:hypothetical protein MRB53_034900 [Persea americana]|uniref:Uncharacterized protein n=1 Tax=Persea americana TaxID=3435 RepID=A0ACC2K3E6_PERAE|nr:hypothetical protein MRB53_034900 [Persea americana]
MAATAAAAAKTPVKQQRQHGNRKTAMTVMAPPIFSYANHDGDQRCETLLRRQSARRDPVSPFPAVFFLCNSAVAALSLVLEIFFSGEVPAGIPGFLLRFLHDDVSNNAQQRRSAAATIYLLFRRSVPAHVQDPVCDDSGD